MWDVTALRVEHIPTTNCPNRAGPNARLPLTGSPRVGHQGIGLPAGPAVSTTAVVPTQLSGLPRNVNDQRFIGSLTGLRFVAAATVAIGHGAPSLAQGGLSEFIAQVSSIGMTMFFMLSGFVLW